MEDNTYDFLRKPMNRQQVDNIPDNINIAVPCADFLEGLVLDQRPYRFRESVSGLRRRPFKDGLGQSRLASGKLGLRLFDLRSLVALGKSLGQTAIRARPRSGRLVKIQSE